MAENDIENNSVHQYTNSEPNGNSPHQNQNEALPIIKIPTEENSEKEAA